MKKAFWVLSFVLAASTAAAQNTVVCEHWPNASLPLTAGIPDMQSLANAPDLLGQPASTSAHALFEAPVNVPGGRFVRRCKARFTATLTGNYTFWIAANQFGMLWLGPDGDFAGEASIAWMTQAYPPPSRYWTRYPQQKSVQYLVAGQTYHLLAIQAETVDALNHMAVGLLTPPTATFPNGEYKRPIPGSFFQDPVSLTLTASRTTVNQGFASTLSYAPLFASACNASASPPDPYWYGALDPAGGSITVTPAASTVFSLTCSGNLGGNTSASLSVTVIPPVTATLALNPLAFLDGQCSSLTWSQVNATACTASSSPADPAWTGSVALAGGARLVCPTTNTAYSLTCTNSGWSALATADAAVTPVEELNPRIAEFTPSTDHDVILSDGRDAVLRYELSFYFYGATEPFMSGIDLGKPFPQADGKIRVDLAVLPGFSYPLQNGLYEARVSAIGPDSLSVSAPSNVFLFRFGG